MSNIHQTIIIRTDLFDLPTDIGLLSAQVAHIHFETLRQRLKPSTDLLTLADTDYKEWLGNPYIHVRQVPNQEALQHFYDLATNAKIPVVSWHDTINVRLSSTMKQAFPDIMVGIALGPCDADAIRTVIGDLPWL